MSLTQLIFVLTIIFMANCLIDLHLIENYFNEKSIKSASVLGCFKKYEKIALAKLLMLQTRPVSVLDINQRKIFENLKITHNHVGIVLDGDCPRSEEFLITSGQLKLFDVKHYWLVTSSSINITETFKNVTLNINAEIQIVVCGDASNWTIFDIYNPAFEQEGSLKITKIGFYNKEQGYCAKSVEAKYWRRRNMTGVIFKTIVTLPTPINETLEDHLYKERDKQVNTFNRFHTKLLRFCSDYYNFSMDIGIVSSWGYPQPNGSFDGMVGALERKEIDFGCSPIFVREDRARVIDYGKNTWAFKAGFIFRSPKSRTSIEIFLKPLSASIWLITALLTALCIFILKAATAVEGKKYHCSEETLWSWSVLFTIGALCQQGASSTPRMLCGRITTISIFVFSFIIYQFYTSSIVSHLLMKPVKRIENVKDLLHSSLKVGCEDYIYNRDLFAHTTDETLKQLFFKKIYGQGNTSHFWPTEFGLKLVGKGGYAFHVEVARAYPIIEKTFSDVSICELKEVELYRNKDLYGTYQKGSSFREMIETCLHRQTECGIIFREQRNWHPRKPECVMSSQSAITLNVGLDEFYPALLILLMGIGASFVILLLEKQIKIMKDRQTRLLNIRKKQEKVIIPFVK